MAIFLLGAAGLLVYQNVQLKKQLVAMQTTGQPELSPQASPDLLPAQGEIVDWVGYTNAESNYTVQYPSSWIAEKSTNTNYDIVSFSPPQPTGVSPTDPTGTITILVDNFRGSITTDGEALTAFQSFMDSCSSQTPTQCTEKNSDVYTLEKQIRVAGNPAFQVYGGCCDHFGRHVFLYRGNLSYQITLYNLGPTVETLPNEDVFSQMLSSFAFIK